MTLSFSKMELKPKIFLFLVTVLLALWVAYFLVFLPQRVRLAELDSQYRAESSQVAVIEAYALKHPDSARHQAELRQRIAQVDKMLPAGQAVSEFLIQVEGAAKQGGVQLVQVKPAQPVNKDGYQEIQLEIQVKGDYFQTVKFLKNLEDGTRFNSVNTISTQARPGGLESKLTVAIYNQR